MQSNITYSEIATLANVSAATVSRVLNNTVPVKEETRRKVLSVLEQLGINTSALQVKNTSMPTGSPVIMNIPSMENPFYSEIARGAKTCADQHGYHLLINETEVNSNTVDALVSLIKGMKVVGIITTNCILPEFVSKLNSILPLVQCCECVTSLNAPYVTINDTLAAKRVMDHLFSIGRRRIALINGPLRYKYAQGRLEGYVSSLRNNQIELDNDLVIHLPDVDYGIAVTAATALLESARPPDAIFAVSDVFAVGVLKAAAKTGLRVPEDVAVVGFDNVEVSSMTSPAITTINQPRYEMGYSSCSILIERINNPDLPPRNMVMDVELIVRESSMLNGS